MVILRNPSLISKNGFHIITRVLTRKIEHSVQKNGFKLLSW